MKLREVDPLEPQPGEQVRIYTPFPTVDPDHQMNWDEGEVMLNTSDVMVLATMSEGTALSFNHDLDEAFGSIYYIVEEA